MIKTVINIEDLNERTADDNELAIELLDMLILAKSNYFSEIDDAIRKKDMNKLAGELHKLKSTVAILGFNNLAEEMANVEKIALKKNDGIDYSSKINSIFISLNDHIVELEKILKK